MLTYNEIKPKKIIVLDGEPWEVLDSHVFRKQMRKPVNQTKLKNLRTGKISERSFHQSETVFEAEIVKKQITFLYNKLSRQTNVVEYWFCETKNPKERFFLSQETMGINPAFLKENTPVDMLTFEEETIGIKLPIKLAFTVKEAPPSTRGNTAQVGTKQVLLENNATVNVPLFVEMGDRILVNTETGEYAGRE